MAREGQVFIIGVAGQMLNGKDTLADRLQSALALRGKVWDRTALADNVKDVICKTFGVTRAFVEEWKVKNEPPPGFDMTIRQALQFVGDGFRKIKPTIWMDLRFSGTRPQIISDVRYIDELRRVKKEGGLNILVGRPDKLNDDPNGSEAQIRPYVARALEHCKGKSVFMHNEMPYCAELPEFDLFDLFVRNDGTLLEFEAVIDRWVTPFISDFVFEF